MNLNLSGHHLEITPAIREHVISKIEKIKRHFDKVIDVNVVLSVDKLVQKAEANVHLSGKTIFVECDDSNLYVAIDTLVEKLDRQISKYTGKNSARRHDETGKFPAIEPE